MRMLGFAGVVELFPEPRRDLLADLARVDHGIHTPVDRKNEIELAKVGFDRRGHVRVLELAGELFARMRPGTMHLSEGRRMRCFSRERSELRLPVGTELGRHP